jgi:hypothetical protein
LQRLSLRAEGEAIQAAVTILDCFASLAMTEGHSITSLEPRRAGGAVGIDGAHHVRVGLRLVGSKQSRQLLDRRPMIVDAQIDVGKRLAVHDQERRRRHRLVLAAGRFACPQRIDQPAPERRSMRSRTP